jgi:uncharacterized protein
MAARLLFLPGIGGSGPEHWQTRWEASLPEARRVAARDWDHPVRAEWVAALEAEVARSPARVVLVAHSLGCLQVAHWAAATQLAAFVRAALLVAPADPDGPVFPAEAESFRPLPDRQLPFTSIVVASADDPYASPAFSRRAAALWGSILVELGRRGHINAASDLGDWPEGLKYLNALLRAAAPSARKR